MAARPHPEVPASPGFLTPSLASRTVVVMAHPDDETVGFGARLPRLREATFVYVTDGAPRHLDDARNAGFADWRSYARARRCELEAALSLAGIDSARVRLLDLPDQESTEQVYWLTQRLKQILQATGAVQVLTHPYEGGHPDHDTAAFAVHTACRLLAADRRPVPLVIEAAYYHSRGGRILTGEFLPPAGDGLEVLPLTPEERALKQGLVECYATQARTLGLFSLERECFRPAPHYDFESAPHPGPLLYELLDWEITGSRWRALARAAAQRLGLPPGGGASPDSGMMHEDPACD